MRTAKNVMSAAAMSKAEWAASAKIPRLPVAKPTTNFKPVKKTAATTEVRAADVFSEVAVLMLVPCYCHRFNPNRSRLDVSAQINIIANRNYPFIHGF